MKQVALIASALFVLATTGCGKDDKAEDQGKGAESNKPASGEAAKAGGDDKGGGEAAGPKEMELEKIPGIVATVPGDAEAGALGITAMNYKCQVMYSEVNDMSPSYDNTLKNVEKGNRGGPVKEMIKNEKTDDDNWVISYSTEKGKFGYQSRRKVGDKLISCGRVSSSEEGHKCVASICESMKAK